MLPQALEEQEIRTPEIGDWESFVTPPVKRVVWVPTKRLWLLVLLGAPIVGLCEWLGIRNSFWFYNGFLAVFSVLTAYLGAGVENLRFRRRHDAVLSVRARNKIIVEIENEGSDRVKGFIRDEGPGQFLHEAQTHSLLVEPGRNFRFEYWLTPPERGQFFFRSTFLRIACPLGLMERQFEWNTESTVQVYPNLLALREFMLLNQQGRLRQVGVRKSKMRGIGTEFESLREYTLGDDYRKIDWKATARMGKTIVRNFEVERNQCVIICVDCGRTMMAEINGVRKLDLVLDSILMLIQSALGAGDNVGFLAYGMDVIKYVPPKRGSRQMGILLNAMHDLVAEPVESDPVRAFAYLTSRHTRRSLIINFTSVDDRDRGREVRQSFGAMVRGHIGLVASINDPRFREALREFPETSDTLFQYASAHFLTEERRMASSELRSAGLSVLDSEPQDLATDLVNFYLEVKARGRL